MLILLLKADQPGLFDKLVHVAGSVSKTGVVTKPHTAVRHVRPHEPKAVHPAKHAETADLFSPRAKEAPKPKKPAMPAAPDLFAPETVAKVEAKTKEAAAKPDVSEKPAKLDTLPEPVKETAKIDHVAPTAKVDYDQPFDKIQVPAFGVPAGISKGARRKLNMDAALVAGSQSNFSPADLALLRQYSGNGGCGASLNEFYTDPAVTVAMWSVLHSLGVVGEGSTALEPCCATGVFLETAPPGVTVTGVELDPTSARIGGILHPGHEVKQSALEMFAPTDERQFDAVVGNAPFGLRGSWVNKDKGDLSRAEGYFMDTALDKLRGGGVVAMIVPTGLMDAKRDRKVRERLLRKGEFLGAMRMPNTAFEHSHTVVTSDILFFRKRPQDVAGALMAVDKKDLQALGVWDEEYLNGSYFEGRGAGNVLGTVAPGRYAKMGDGDDITVEGSMVGVPAAIAAFKPEISDAEPLTVERILDAVTDDDAKERVRAGALKKPYDTSKRGDVKTIDGIEYILEGEPLRWHRVSDFMASKAVGDAADLAADIERAMSDDGYAESSGLAERVKAYVAAHGVPSKNTELMLAASVDKSLFRLIGAVKPDGSLSDLVAGRKAVAVESSFDAAAQTLALEAGDFTPEQVAARWHGGDSEAVLDHLYAAPEYALDPVTGRWTSSDQYMSGELWPKLDAVRAALEGDAGQPEDRAKFERQAKMLDEAIDPRSLEDVELMLNSAFLPLHVIEGFFNRDPTQFEGQYARQPLKLTFDRGVYAVNGGPWGTDLLGKYLNRTGVKKDDDMPKIDKWNAEFKEWLCASKFREEIEDLYNRKFRGFRQREYSDAPFEIPGLATGGIKPHIYSGIRRALETGKGIIADDVGLGKTVQGLILARMAKVTGKAKKPMIVVPKSVLANWVAEAEKWFPGANVMVIGETYTRDKNGGLKGKQDNAAERNRKYHDLTQNDYDFVLISQPAWNDLDLDPVTKGQYINEDFWVQRGDALGNAGDKRTNKIREAYDQAIAQRDFKTRTDAIYFNDLGVDMIIGDELHAYKNLYAARNRFGQVPKFLGGTGLSNRALDMALKTKWLRGENGGLNVYGLTATPTKNSPLEIYSMLTHIAPEAFEQIGIRNSEEFLDRFCEFREESVLTTSGNIESALVTAGFKNMDELRDIMRRYINRRTAESVGLQLPARDDRQHLVDMSAEQNAVYADLREAALASKSKDGPHIFSVMSDMAKAAMDLELYSPEKYTGAQSPKYDAAIEQIKAGAEDGGQVVFADHVHVHGKLVDALVAAGMPRDQIGVMNADSAPTSASRQNITDAFNANKLKVVIGNTATMGEGQNMQMGTTDIHHMDLPWDPASFQQRNGRGLRQGNTKESVRIHTYLAKGSFDGYRHQSMRAKKDWQDLLWNGGDRVENLAREGAMSRDDLMVMLSANPDEAREALAKNKDIAKAKFDAQKYTTAAENFGRFQSMRTTLAKMKPADREKPAAQRLAVKADRLKIALQADTHFKAKHALDSTSPVVLQPQTGEAYHEGVAFDVEPSEGAIHGGGKFVVTRAWHDPSMGDVVKVRRYGAATGGEFTMGVDKLAHGVKHFEYDAKAEAAETASAFAAAANEKLGALKGLKDLHGLPSSVIEANHDAIQKQAKAGLKGYGFDLGYGDVGMIKPSGELIARSAYNARAQPDDVDLMLPTDANREKAIQAYMTDERTKKITREAVTGRRGGRTNESRETIKYPGEYGLSGTSNRWGSIGENVFGKGFKEEAHGRFEREQLEAARRAPTFADALQVAAQTAVGQYGTVGAWPKRALAILWAKAKRDGKLDSTMSSQMGAMSTAQFKISDYKNAAQMTVREGLQALAGHRNMHDLAAAFAVDGAPDPHAAAKALLGLRPEHIGAGLRHVIAKHPHMAGVKASELARIDGPKRAYDYHSQPTPAHPLHAKFGDRANSMTLQEMSDELNADGGEEDTRDAA
jgi:hypothetical protein